ncbi:hypothetical protein H920_08398 [Fukomys damarensis]|uniref:Uncharacterized protein n=1 Tax=Fukomys damarensis TaxID=885580 RepID=A0A091DIB8_FUKDA|nr:hypothetical protein H920_08398 [Fukomys damarensis]
MVFTMRTWLFSSEEELRASLSLGKAAVLIRGALIFTTSITFWHQCRSLSLMAQILNPTGTDFLASTTGLWAFQVQILSMDKNETIAVGSRPMAGLVKDTALGSRPSAGLVWVITVGSRLLLDSLDL